MKCSSTILIFLILVQFLAAVATKVSHKNKAHAKKSFSAEEEDPSAHPLPSRWTTGYRNHFGHVNVSNRHREYNKKLVTKHKYEDITRSMLKKNLKSK